MYKPNELSLKKSTANYVVWLMVAVWILSETHFHLIQIFLECLLIATLITLLSALNYKKLEWFLFSLMLAISSLAFVNLELVPAAIAMKNITLSLLAYLVFSKYKLREGPIYFLAFLCLSLILIQLFITGHFPLPIGQMLVNSHWLLESRPLGLFLAEHSSAFFLMTVFFGISFTRNLWFLDLLLIQRTNVFTAFFTLASAKLIFLIKFVNRVCERNLIVVLFGFSTIIFIIYFAQGIILDFLLFYNVSAESSGRVILDQMFHARYYYENINLMPSDILKVGEGLLVVEVGYVRYAIEFGAFFSISFIFLLLKKLRSWRVLILISLLHYSFIHMPLILYVMFLFQCRRDSVGINTRKIKNV